MRILFMGTPDFAKESLECLYNAGYKIIGVVTNPDKPKGRGMKMVYSPVKEYAIEQNLKVYQPEKVRKNTEFIQNAFQYTYNYNKKPLGEKLFFFSIGLVLEKIYQNKMPKSKIKQLQELAESQKADLEKFSEKNIEEYFAWILPIACEIYQKKEEIKKL